MSRRWHRDAARGCTTRATSKFVVITGEKVSTTSDRFTTDEVVAAVSGDVIQDLEVHFVEGVRCEGATSRGARCEATSRV
jgi:hypothetical protein